MTMHKRQGFTLIELLVVIAIIAILLAILMPALQKVKEQGKKIVCSNNQKQIGISFNMYGSENDNKLPLNQGGYWLWDIAYSTTDYIMNTGGDKRTFYCPADPTKKPEMAIFWQYGQNPDIGNDSDWVVEPKTGRGNLYRVTSYFWMMDTVQGRPEQPEGEPTKKWVKTLTCKQPASTDLITDATLSTGPNEETTSFTEVAGGLWSRWQIYDRTNHIGRGGKPVGTNVLYVDGHLEWRLFRDMVVRYTVPPYHWW
jgi:prepilin-type N-terminal cleavage/methylation domain-containing protein/prepilin-type processing-associated H-X9-DG protein